MLIQPFDVPTDRVPDPTDGDSGDETEFIDVIRRATGVPPPANLTFVTPIFKVETQPRDQTIKARMPPVGGKSYLEDAAVTALVNSVLERNQTEAELEPRRTMGQDI